MRQAQRVRPDLQIFAVQAFEEAALAFTAGLAKAGRQNFLPERIGGWWCRHAEIDVLAISDSEKTALAGECKWSTHPVGVNVLAELKEKAQTLVREYDLRRVDLALFNRAGFMPALEEEARAEGVGLYTVAELVQGEG